MPINNGVGMLAQALQNTLHGRRQAAMQEQQLGAQQQQHDDTMAFHRDSANAQMQSGILRQQLEDANRAKMAEMQDARMEAADERRGVREGQNIKTRQDWETGHKSLDRDARKEEQEAYRAMMIKLHEMDNAGRVKVQQLKPVPHGGPKELKPYDSPEGVELRDAQNTLRNAPYDQVLKQIHEDALKKFRARYPGAPVPLTL